MTDDAKENDRLLQLSEMNLLYAATEWTQSENMTPHHQGFNAGWIAAMRLRNLQNAAPQMPQAARPGPGESIATGATPEPVFSSAAAAPQYVSQAPLHPNVDGQDFYELCQQYRYSREISPHPNTPNTVQAFNNLREYIKTGWLPWPSYERSDISGSGA